jgi:hypothetical protein
MSTYLRAIGIFGIGVLVVGCDDAPLFPYPLDAGPEISPPYNPGPTPIPESVDCAPTNGFSIWPADADACWRRATWAKGCVLEIADHPEHGIPPLVWGPCPRGSPPGCEKIVANWPHEDHGPPMAPPIVRAVLGGYRVSSYQGWADGMVRNTIFDPEGKPIVAFRGLRNCVATRVMQGAQWTWFGVQPFGVGSSYIVAPINQWHDPTKIPLDAGSQWQSADDEIIALWLGDGSTNLIYDRLSEQSYLLNKPGPGAGYAQPFVVNGNVIVRYYPAFEKPEAWIWSGKTKKVEPIVQPAPDIISDFRSDGKTLVWVQNPPKPVQGQGNYPPGDLWTSPFATTKAELKPKKHRAVPIVGESMAGGGYYAFWSADDHIHIYRLSDAHHWEFVLSESMGLMFEMSYLDEKYLWFTTRRGTYRQPLSTLGPGDPAP